MHPALSEKGLADKVDDLTSRLMKFYGEKNGKKILQKQFKNSIFSKKSAAKLFTDGKWRLFRRNNVFTRHFYGRLLLDEIKK